VTDHTGVVDHTHNYEVIFTDDSWFLECKCGHVLWSADIVDIVNEFTKLALQPT
jgi:hypothetical protein